MGGDNPIEASAVRAMPIRAIRDALKQRDVDMTGCLEKEDLVALLLANWCMVPSHDHEEPPSSPTAAGPTISSGGGSPLPSEADVGSSTPAPTAADPSGGGRGSCPLTAAGSSGSQQDGGSGPSHRKLAGSLGFYTYRCEHCSNKGGKMLHCSKCGTGGYCSKECQVAHWPEHKKVCKQRIEAEQRAEVILGAGVVKAFSKALKAWIHRNMHWLTLMAAAGLWLPDPPLYTSHVLCLDIHSDFSQEARPKFAVKNHDVVTLEELYEITAPSGGPGPLPDGPPDRALIFLVCASNSSEATSFSPGRPENVMSVMKSVGLDADTRSHLATGRLKLPPLAEIAAQLSQWS